MDGTLQLRGFFFGDRRSYFESANAYLFLAVDRPSRVSGYGVRGKTVFRFDEAPDGDQILLTAQCPVNAMHQELDNTALKLDFFTIYFTPLASNIDPRGAPDLNVRAPIVTLKIGTAETDISLIRWAAA